MAATGEASNGQPVQVELFVDGAWVDITSYVLARDGSGKVSITRGKRDEGGEVEFSTCRFDLNNRDGRFSPRNPTSPYYGKLGRNQPLRVSVPNGTGGKAYRFWGEVSSWPQRWDVSGKDVWVELEAAGIMRRLAQGAAPARSVIYNAVTDPQLTSLRAYWPCEDAEGAVRLASALTSGSAMTVSGTATLAAYSGFAASDPLPDISAASITGGVAKYDDPVATQVRFLIHIPVDGLADGQVLCRVEQQDYISGGAQFWELYYSTSSTSVVLRQNAADGSVMGSADVTHTLDVRGRHMRISIELQETGSSCARAVRITDLATLTTYSATDTINGTALTRVTSVSLGPASRSVVGPIGVRGLPNTAVGHVTVQSEITSTADLGVRMSPAGETAGRRIQRLCAEEGIPFDWVGDLDDTVAMGGQSRLKPLELIQEAAAADEGVLYENLAVFGLGYRTRASLYNQAPALTLSYSGHELSDVPTPVDDDQLTRNRVTVSLPTSEVAVQSLDTGPMSTQDPPAGIGVYGSDVTLNLVDSSTLADQAAWRLHLGTVDEARYPQISVNLAHPALASNPPLRAAVLGLRQGDRLAITNPPPWIPDSISQIALGLSETIDHFEHRIAFNCAPESPYRVGYLDDPVYGRLDTDGSVLAEPVSSAGTVLDVMTTSGPVWTSAAADMPMDVRVGGEVMTVSAVSPLVADTFARSSASGWGTSSSGDVWTEVGGAAGDRTVTGSAGVVNLGSTPSTIRFQLAASGVADAVVLVSMSPGQVSAGNSLAPGVITRYQDSSNYYRARLLFREDSTVGLAITRAGVDQGTYETGQTYLANDVWWIRVQLAGQTVSARAWKNGTTEPGAWQLERTITSSPITSGAVGLSASAAGGFTNVNATVSYGGFVMSGPQTFTVTRSVNGVQKAQTVGTDVRLANPTILAL
ncbi:hypothetical protein [Streptomyces cucumeris]|uniref:hypothetical protein n=1 Tax=Streptomyces cucumeris TaxID=2962890 RepID=UPI003D728F87